MNSALYALAILTAVLLAIGQLLFKLGANKINATSIPEFLSSALDSSADNSGRFPTAAFIHQLRYTEHAEEPDP
tara:strand:+ start:262 stop:483 length:222 start_codon:yes stop_codon:yes gene_type:complete